MRCNSRTTVRTAAVLKIVHTLDGYVKILKHCYLYPNGPYISVQTINSTAHFGQSTRVPGTVSRTYRVSGMPFLTVFTADDENNSLVRTRALTATLSLSCKIDPTLIRSNLSTPKSWCSHTSPDQATTTIYTTTEKTKSAVSPNRLGRVTNLQYERVSSRAASVLYNNPLQRAVVAVLKVSPPTPVAPSCC